MKNLRQIIYDFVSIVFSLCVVFLVCLLLYVHVAQPFRVQGESMLPTLYDGDKMIMNKVSQLERFDIVVFPDPMGSNDTYVKRIIGLPRDSLEYSNNQLYLNGTVVEELYLAPGTVTNDFSLWDTVGCEVIPDGYVFVMGDNREKSGDSREFGLVETDSILGKSDLIYSPKNRRGRLVDYDLDENYSVLAD